MEADPAIEGSMKEDLFYWTNYSGEPDSNPGIVKKEPWLWVDQICINQSNIGERNSQVTLMADIYRQVAQVLAWIGLATDDSIEGLWSIHDHIRHPLEKDFQAFKSFLSRPYWQRLWVMQECLLAREVQICCGRDTVPLEKLHKLGESLRQKFISSSRCEQWDDIEPFFPVHLFKNPGNSVIFKSPLSEVAILMELECQDVRDKIFGFQNCLSEGRVPVDYSITPLDLFL
jgi:hypothetical protein